MPRTKIDLSHNAISRAEDLDELAAILFPCNRRHQRIFAALFIELKWADGQFLPSLDWIAQEHNLSRRVLETVRAKMRRMGLLDHVSRFNKRYGYREGWVFSRKFGRALGRLADLAANLKEKKGPVQERKDRDALQYI